MSKPPADSPNTVMFFASPPNLSTLAFTHFNAAQVFTFPARTPAAASASEPELAAITDEETLDVDLTTSEGDDEELLLGSDDILTSPVGAPPINPPEDEDEADQPTASGGGGRASPRPARACADTPRR